MIDRVGIRIALYIRIQNDDSSGIPGLHESLSVPDSGVVSIYSFDFASHAWKIFENFNQGEMFKIDLFLCKVTLL